MVYGVFGGCYSDWYIVGYFDNRLDADKYSAAFGSGDYYVKEIKNLSDEEDLSKITLKYTHEIVFDFGEDSCEWVMREEPSRYNCYVADDFKANFIKYLGYRYNWVMFSINIAEDNRKLSEKIAQDYLAQLLSYGNSKEINDRNVKLMNDQFIEPYKLKEKIKKQEEKNKKN